MSDPQFLSTILILPVQDIDDTVAWYERALDLQTQRIFGSGRRGETEDFANYAIMRRDAVEVHFILDEGGPVWTRAGTGYLFLTVRDVDREHAQVTSRGIPLLRGLAVQNWGARAPRRRARTIGCRGQIVTNGQANGGVVVFAMKLVTAVNLPGGWRRWQRDVLGMRPVELGRRLPPAGRSLRLRSKAIKTG